MQDEGKTRQQLIDESMELCRQVAKLRVSEAGDEQLGEDQPLKIGEILMQMGFLTEQQLEEALQKQKEANALGHERKTLGEVLLESGIVTEDQLHNGLAEQLTRLNNILTIYIDERLLMDAINTIHQYGFSAKSSDPEEVKSLFEKWKASEAARKQAEEALHEVEEKYRVLVENANEAILVAQDEMFRFVNPNAVKLTGYSEDELTSRPYAEFVHPDDRETVIERYHRRLEGEEVIPVYSFRIVDKDGNIKWVEVNTVLIAWSERPAILNFLSDITDRKRMEAEILKIQKLESVGILAGGIAHDFNNILTAILGNIALARMHTDSEMVNEKLEKAEKASMQAKDLTHELLTFSKGGSPVKELAPIDEVLRDSAIFALRGSNARCEFHIADDLWPLEVDTGQISRVIINLVVNANQASSNGGTIKVAAHNETLGMETGLPLGPGPYVKISVEDHGIGIPEENLQNIFYPYFTTKKEGNGLGLATSYSIIRNHGGHITVESQVDKGTTFCVYLPAAPDKALMEKEERKDKSIKGKGRVMVMDDEEIVREIASDMLTNIGYKATVAADGDEAVELYRAAKESGNPFNAVIMDLTIIGGMGGKATLDRLMEIDPDVNAVVTSGYSNDPIMSDFGKYGFKGVIAKPYRPMELNEVLHKAITGARESQDASHSL